MKKKTIFIFLLVLFMLPIIKVNALQKSDLYETDSKKGYRCYFLCKDITCQNKAVLYTNRTMPNYASATVNWDFDNVINNGLNVFSNIDYPGSEFTTLGDFYSKGINNDLTNTYTTVPDALSEMEQGIKDAWSSGKFGNTKVHGKTGTSTKEAKSVAEIISEFENLNENSDVSPYQCLMATQTYEILTSDYYTVTNTSSLQFIYEDDYNNGTISVYDLSYEVSELQNKLFLEGTGFLKVTDGELNTGFVNPEDDQILGDDDSYVPDVQDIDDSKLSDDEKANLKYIQVCVKDYSPISHDTLLTKCLECGLNVNDAGLIQYDGICNKGFTFGAVGSVVEQYENPALFKLIGSNTILSCYDIRIATYVWRAICIIAPFLLMIFGSLDYFKAIIAGDEKGQKDAKKKFPLRIVAFLLLILLPIILRLIFKLGQFSSGNLGLLKCVVTFDTTSTDPIHTSKDYDPGNVSKDDDDDKETDVCKEYINTNLLTCNQITNFSCCTNETRDYFGKSCKPVEVPGNGTVACDFKNTSDKKDAELRVSCVETIKNKSCGDITDMDCCIKDGLGNICETYHPLEAGDTSVTACRTKEVEPEEEKRTDLATVSCKKIPYQQCGTIRDVNGNKCERYVDDEDGNKLKCRKATMHCNDKLKDFCSKTTDDYGNACRISTLPGVDCEVNPTPKKCADYRTSSACESKDDYGNKCKWSYGKISTGECIEY